MAFCLTIQSDLKLNAVVKDLRHFDACPSALRISLHFRQMLKWRAERSVQRRSSLVRNEFYRKCASHGFAAVSCAKPFQILYGQFAGVFASFAPGADGCAQNAEWPKHDCS